MQTAVQLTADRLVVDHPDPDAPDLVRVVAERPEGIDFEDLIEALLGEISGGPEDDIERTGTLPGETLKARKGTFLLTVDPSRTRGGRFAGRDRVEGPGPGHPAGDRGTGRRAPEPLGAGGRGPRARQDPDAARRQVTA